MRLLRPACWRPSCCSRSSPRPRRPRRSTSRASRRRARAAGRSTAWPSTRGCACGSTAAPSTWARRAPASAAPSQAIGRRRAILVDPARRASQARRPARVAPTGARSPAARTTTPASASTPARRPRRGRCRPGPPRPTGRSASTSAALNRGCSQPNLTASWVAEQVAAGWHLIPTYVGLQAPTSACTSCAKLSPSLASRSQGTEAADDAVADAQSIGMGAGQPDLLRHGGLHAHLERHRATLTFLAAWTDAAARARLRLRRLQLQRLRHRRPRPPGRRHATCCPTTSGSPTGTAAQNALDPYVPPTPGPTHQRIHQYRGGHDETYGGMTINIDNNYVEGATVGGTLTAPVLPPLTVKHVRPEGGTVRVWVRCGWAEGESCPGQIILRTHARLPLRARPGVPTKVVRVGVSHRTFRLGGGRSHTFRVGAQLARPPAVRPTRLPQDAAAGRHPRRPRDARGQLRRGR